MQKLIQISSHRWTGEIRRTTHSFVSICTDRPRSYVDLSWGRICFDIRTTTAAAWIRLQLFLVHTRRHNPTSRCETSIIIRMFLHRTRWVSPWVLNHAYTQPKEPASHYAFYTRLLFERTLLIMSSNKKRSSGWIKPNKEQCVIIYPTTCNVQVFCCTADYYWQKHLREQTISKILNIGLEQLLSSNSTHTKPAPSTS